MSANQEPANPPAEDDWWLCSQLVSVTIPRSGADWSTALLEEISGTGLRLALDERIREGTVLQVRADGFEVEVAVVECRVRTDDFCLETRFPQDFRWAPDLWTPDHLYRPPARRARAAGSS